MKWILYIVRSLGDKKEYRQFIDFFDTGKEMEEYMGHFSHSPTYREFRTNKISDSQYKMVERILYGDKPKEVI